MKKYLSLLCSLSLLAGALVFNNLEDKNVCAEDTSDWTTQALDFSKWKVVNDAQGSQVDFTYVDDNGGSYRLDLNKSEASYSGVSIDLADQIDELKNTIGIGNAIGFNFKLINKIELDSNNVLKFSFAFTDKSTWDILPTQVEGGFPSLYDIDDEKDIYISFSSLPEGKEYYDIVSFNIGISGGDSASLYVYGFNMPFSTEASAQLITCDTAKTIGNYGNTFGYFQYGGESGTDTKTEVINDQTKSKEDDNSALKVSINGSGSTTDRFYSVYFKLASQVADAFLTSPREISFWVYNEKAIAGGLYFKIGSTEIKTGKLYDSSETEIDFTRNLDFVGLRKFTLELTPTQFKQTELEIGMWGADLDSAFCLSKFQFLDARKQTIGYKYIGAMSSYSYTDYTDGPGFAYNIKNNCEYSHNADETAVEIVRPANVSSYYSCVYLQRFGQVAQELNIRKPSRISLWVNNITEVPAGSGLAFKIKTSDSTITEIYPTNDDRDLDFTGFKNYLFDVSTINIFDIVEFEFAIWGVGAADVYYSDLEIYDASAVDPTPTSYQQIVIEDNDILPANSSISATMEKVNENIKFTVTRDGFEGKAYIERTLDDFFNEHTTDIELKITSSKHYEKKIINCELVYVDETNKEAAYIVGSTNFTGANAGIFDINLTELPYFINNNNIIKLRISCVGSDPSVIINVTSLKYKNSDSFIAPSVYTKSICDFNEQSDILDWGISGEGSSIYYKEYDNTDSVEGDGCLKFTFSSMTEYDFSWSEIYYDLNDLVVKNADKDLYGISFWLNNTHYITSGAFGFWIKVSQTDGMEFEARYDHIMAEQGTQNSLAFTGWQKIQIPLDGASYSECNYNAGYSKDHEREFDWKKLQFIKFGFWGRYYNVDDGVSAIAKIDDFRFVSREQIIDESKVYQINYILNGGRLPRNAQKTYIEGTTVQLPTPTRAGFIFEGWYDSQSLSGNQITSIESDCKGDITLYAAWSKDENYSKTITIIVVASVVGAVLIAGAIILIIKKKKSMA